MGFENERNLLNESIQVVTLIFPLTSEKKKEKNNNFLHADRIIFLEIISNNNKFTLNEFKQFQKKVRKRSFFPKPISKISLESVTKS